MMIPWAGLAVVAATVVVALREAGTVGAVMVAAEAVMWQLRVQ